jgi:hypothetical protein
VEPQCLLPAELQAGGILLDFELKILVDGSVIVVTNVYASCTHDLCPSFLSELVSLTDAAHGQPWLIVGDFNLTRDPTACNNDNFDVVVVDAFNAAINTALLQELPLLDRRFSWSNRRGSPPTLVCLDHAFVNAEWGHVLFNSRLETVPRPVSDNVPLLIMTSASVPTSNIFR